MKRFFSFMMAVVLVLSLSVTAFAAGGPGSITITNAIVDETYTVYKIFDAALTADNSGISYSVVPDSALATEMFGTTGTGADYFTYDAASGAVALKSGVSESDLFTYLKNLEHKQKIGESIKATSTTVYFTELPYGYYLIDPTNGAVVTIDSTKPHADVIDKNQTTTNLDKKIKAEGDANWADATSANVGDTVNFKVEFTALNYKGEEKVAKYTIEDTLTPAGWAEIDTTRIVVKVGTKTLEAGTDYTISADTNGFEIEIPWVDDDGNFLYDPSVPVEVTYSATVLGAAASADPVAQNNENTAELTWNNTTETDETTTKVYNMGFTKVDGTNSVPLEGAKFKLYRDQACTDLVCVSGSNGVYTVGGTSNEVETPEGGKVVIMGLKEGKYYLKETVAPAGYNLLTDAKPVTVGGDTPSITMKINGTDYIVNNDELTVENNTGVVLPSTGGEGTMKMITIGTIVAMAFAVLLITHKKMTIYQD